MRERLDKCINGIIQLKDWLITEFKQLKGRKYAIFVYLLIILSVLLIGSLLCTLFGCGSLIGFIANQSSAIQIVTSSLEPLVKINAVERVGEAVGICSFLIAWIYAALDKRELGIRYSDLLLELYPGYHHFVVLHLIAFILCVWMSKVGNLEAAVLALAILLVGTSLQWFTLKNLILFTPKRVKIALDRWQRLVTESGKNHNKNLLTYIHLMAKALALETDDCYKQLFPIFTGATEQYINGLLPETPNEWEQAIKGVSKIWRSLLDGRNVNEQDLFISNVFQECTSPRSLKSFSLGYLLHLYDQSIRDGLVNESALLAVSKEVAKLTQRSCGQQNSELSFYMEAAFTLWIWMYFLCGTIGLNSELFQLAPSKSIAEEDKPWLRGVAQTVFDKSSCQEYLELVLEQLS